MATLYQDILTVDWLKENYLAGIQLTDASGVALPDPIFVESIKAAVRSLEAICSINIMPIKVKSERQDLYITDNQTFWMRGTYKRPLTAISRATLRVGAIEVLNFPMSWLYELDADSGTFCVIPTTDKLEVISHYMVALYAGYTPLLPGGMELDYTAGILLLEGSAVVPIGDTTATFPIGQTILTTDYDVSFSLVNPAPADAGIVVSLGAQGNDDFDVSLSAAPTAPLTVRWVMTGMPADMKRVLGLMASLYPLMVAGTTLVGEGIASKSISVDGLSQSITTTANSETLAYGNRMKAHQAEIDKLLPYLRGRYTGPKMSLL